MLKWSHLLPRSQICLLLFLTRYRHHNWWSIHVCLPWERNQLPIFPFYQCHGKNGNWFLSLGRQTWIGHQLWWQYRVRKSSRNISDQVDKCDHILLAVSQGNLIGAPIRFTCVSISLNTYFFPFSDNSLLKWSHLLPRSQICLLLFLTRHRYHNRWPIHVCLPRERNQLPICPFCLACFHGFGNTIPITTISHWRPRFVVFLTFFKRLHQLK